MLEVTLTPELYGRKLAIADMRWLSMIVVAQPLFVLTATAIALGFPEYTGNSNPGMYGRKGASNTITAFVQNNGGKVSVELDALVAEIAHKGATPLVIAEASRMLGVVALSDVIKPGVRERFASLRALGVRTMMITGDNPLTAAAIAAEAGVDGFVAEATPEQKLDLIRAEQAKGHLVAMVGDGTTRQRWPRRTLAWR